MQFSLSTFIDHHLENLKDSTLNDQNRRSGEVTDCIIETYNDDVIHSGGHIHKVATEIDIATTFPFLSDRHALPHRKYMLWLCVVYPSLVIPVEGSNSYDTDIFYTIIFHVYQLVL